MSGTPDGDVPIRRLEAGLLEHPAAERNDETGLLGQRDEAVRADQAQSRVLPAHERLEALERTVGQAQLRLVLEEELGAVQRTLEGS